MYFLQGMDTTTRKIYQNLSPGDGSEMKLKLFEVCQVPPATTGEIPRSPRRSTWWKKNVVWLDDRQLHVKHQIKFWLVVSIHLKNISENGFIFPNRGEHNDWNHRSCRTHLELAALALNIAFLFDDDSKKHTDFFKNLGGSSKHETSAIAK